MTKRIDKLTLNNQIVSMRKDVKRARLWLINYLNQRTRRLLNKKGNEQQKAKNIRKGERYRSEMLVLKRIDVDEVSKFALCNKLGPAEMQSQLETLETDQRAMLRLVNQKFVHTRVVKFREENPIPVDRLVLLFRALGLKYQKKKLAKKGVAQDTDTDNKKPSPLKKLAASTAKKLAPKTEKKTETKMAKALEVVFTTDEEDSEVDGSDSSQPETANRENVVEEEEEEGSLDECESPSDGESLADDEDDDEDEAAESEAESILDSSKPRDKEPIKPTMADKSSVKEKLKIQWPIVRDVKIDKKDGDCEVRKIDLDNMRSTEIVFEGRNAGSKAPAAVQVPRDSFFLGGVDPSSESDTEARSTQRLPARDYSVNRRERRKNERAGIYPERQVAPRPPPVTRQSAPLSDKKADKFANKTPLGKVRQFGGNHAPPIQSAAAPKEDKLDETNLHPSWQAKRKQVVSLTAFQGKKIKFDDD